jgi:imidazole glycerol-phosphate synthase subunit HisH
LIAILDYGIGNLASVRKAFAKVGAVAKVTSSPDEIAGAERLVLPGVGAFGKAAEHLAEHGLAEPVRKAISDGKPFLGICLGMQLLFETSEEAPGIKGLGLFKGNVRRFEGVTKVPQIGWNEVRQARSSPLFASIPESAFFYFVHSYYVVPRDSTSVLAFADYGGEYAAAVGKGNVWGVQFHPEKSQAWGLALLKNFAEMPCS